MTKKDEPHDLLFLMQNDISNLQNDLKYIEKHRGEQVRGDHLKGEQGEESWAALLRAWLPRTYTVVTRRRLIGADGTPSKELDVLLLKGSYPRALLKKKWLPAAGVVAAFECKTKLDVKGKKALGIRVPKDCPVYEKELKDIQEAAATAADLKSLYPHREGTTIYKELHAPIIYGLLAHTCKGSDYAGRGEVLLSALAESQKERHCRLCLDLVCVADQATWGAYPQRHWEPESPIDALRSSSVRYRRLVVAKDDAGKEARKTEPYNSIAFLVSYLWRRLAWEDPSLRDMAAYFKEIEQRCEPAVESVFKITGPCKSQLSTKLLAQLEGSPPRGVAAPDSNDAEWDENGGTY